MSPPGGTLLVPKPVTFAYLDGDDPLSVAVNGSMFAGISMLQTARSLSCSLYAIHAESQPLTEPDLSFQLASARSYADQLESAMKLYIAALEHVHAVIGQLGITSTTVKRADALKLRDRIVSAGKFPDFEQPILEQINASPEELRLAIEEVAMTTGSSLPDEFGYNELFGSLARAMGKVNIREYLPGWLA